MHPSTPSETGRGSWGGAGRPDPSGAYPPPGRPGHAAAKEPYEAASRHDDPYEPAARHDDPYEAASRHDDEPLDDDFDEVEEVPVRRPLSLAVAGFAALLGAGLVLSAFASGPSERLPLALTIFAVQVLFVLAWTMAVRPPAMWLIAGVAVVVAAGADVAAVTSEVAALAPLGYVAVGGFAAAVIAQLARRANRSEVTESIGSTLVIVVGVVAFAALIVLSRHPAGTQAILVCLTAAAVALTVARILDAFWARPRLAPQVPRGAAGVVAGAMAGTLVAAVLGSYVVHLTPTSGAIIGLVTAAAAVLVDLSTGYAEAGRLMAGEAPTMWLARHLQGPLGAFALAAPVAYATATLLL